jgi:hypothetical protein
VPTPIFQHPLAYLAGIEGVALLRAFAGEHDEAFIRTRLAELRELLADPDRWGPGVEVVPLGAREAHDGWTALRRARLHLRDRGAGFAADPRHPCPRPGRRRGLRDRPDRGIPP